MTTAIYALQKSLQEALDERDRVIKLMKPFADVYFTHTGKMVVDWADEDAARKHKEFYT